MGQLVSSLISFSSPRSTRWRSSPRPDLAFAAHSDGQGWPKAIAKRLALDGHKHGGRLHLSYSCVSPYGPAILVTHGQQRNWKVVDPTVLIPGILSKIRPRNCPNQSYVLCITDSGPAQASVAESSVALPPVSVESRHAVSHALKPPDRMFAASSGQHAGPKCMRTGVEDDQLGTRNCRLGAHSIRLVGDGCRRHHDLLFSDSAPAR
jgi:hypothetical protein